MCDTGLRATLHIYIVLESVEQNHYNIISRKYSVHVHVSVAQQVNRVGLVDFNAEKRYEYLNRQ